MDYLNKIVSRFIDKIHRRVATPVAEQMFKVKEGKDRKLMDED